MSLLKKHRALLLSLHTGWGKTFLAIKLAASSRLKTAVLVHRGILVDQWIASIQKFTTGRVQVLSGHIDPEPTMDFYIFNMAYVHKLWDKFTGTWKLRKLGCYKDIGLLIVDEAHVCCASEMSKALLYFQPRMTIALTATPKRRDGMDALLNLYFGDARIVRISQSPFTVYRLPTNIKPEFTLNYRGKKDWSSVVSYLSDHPGRNQLIVRLVLQFPQKCILILTKRKSQCDQLAELLGVEHVSVTVMKGSDKTYDKTARVLLSTYSKLGVGFDDPRLDMFILGCDVLEIEQYAGRLRHAEGKTRVIIDLVDNDSNCNNHWLERRRWYLSRNGTIKNYYKCFPKELPQPKTVDAPEPKKRLAPKLT